MQRVRFTVCIQQPIAKLTTYVFHKQDVYANRMYLVLTQHQNGILCMLRLHNIYNRIIDHMSEVPWWEQCTFYTVNPYGRPGWWLSSCTDCLTWALIFRYYLRGTAHSYIRVQFDDIIFHSIDCNVIHLCLPNFDWIIALEEWKKCIQIIWMIRDM